MCIRDRGKVFRVQKILGDIIIVGIAQVHGAIGIGNSRGLSKKMQVFSRGYVASGKIKWLQQLQDLTHHNTA